MKARRPEAIIRTLSRISRRWAESQASTRCACIQCLFVPTRPRGGEGNLCAPQSIRAYHGRTGDAGQQIMPGEPPTHAYDYVIVGAGSAGCALAHRLSEEGGARILLI